MIGGPITLSPGEQLVLLLLLGAVVLVVILGIAFVVGSASRAWGVRRGRPARRMFNAGFGLALVIQLAGLGIWLVHVARPTDQRFTPTYEQVQPGASEQVSNVALDIDPDGRRVTISAALPVPHRGRCLPDVAATPVRSSATELEISISVQVPEDSTACVRGSGSAAFELPEALGARDLVIADDDSSRYRLEPGGDCGSAWCTVVVTAPTITSTSPGG